MRAPERNVQLDSGVRVPLASLYSDGPCALVFLRHLGCIFCREQVATLREFTDAPLCFVCLAMPDEVQRFKSELRSPQAYICDPDAEMYREFGIPEARVAQVLNAHVAAQGIRAVLRGQMNKRPRANARMMGAAFVLSAGGEVVFEHRPTDIADLIRPEKLGEEIVRARKG